MKTFLFFLFGLGYCLAQQPSEAPWELRQEQSGIQIFTRPMPGNPVDEFKGVTQIAGNIDSAFSIIQDLPRFLKADPYTVRTEILAREDSNKFWVWTELKMPFFMKSRDMITRIRASKTAKGYFMVIENKPDYAPEREGFVRITQSGLMISLQQLAPDMFELTYKGYLYPTSELTASYANKAVVGSTYERLASLRQMLLDGLATEQD